MYHPILAEICADLDKLTYAVVSWEDKKALAFIARIRHKAKRLDGILEHLNRKLEHGCWDQPCKLCDEKP